MRRIRKLRMAGCDVYVHVHMPWTFSGGWEKGKRKARKKEGGIGGRRFVLYLWAGIWG